MGSEAQPIKRRKLSDEVKERILETIQRDALSPGDILPSERELMSLYGVGRPAIREAMQSLQGMGLIQVRHGERPKVAEASMGSALEQMSLTMQHILAHSGTTLDHLKESRIGLETYLAGLAAKQRTDAQIKTLDTVLESQRKMRDNPIKFMSLDGAFHQSIADISGNPLYGAVTHAIFEWLSVFHVSTVRNPGLENLTISEHEDILAAIVDEDPEEASEAMKRHLLRSNDLYKQANAHTITQAD